MTISIIGAGWVGLVTAAIFSEFGNEVYCVDIREDYIAGLKKGNVPFFEPGLADYLKRNTKAGRIKFTTSYKDAVPNSDVVFICVATPPSKNGEADLTYLFAAIEQTAKNLTKDTLLVIKSTFPIGFEDDLEDIAKKHAKSKFEFAASPEFLKEGTAIEDSLHPDRIVIGTNSKKATEILLNLHSPLPGERIVTDMRSAQIIKYASNAFLAMKISYANALSIICEKAGADVEKVIVGVGADKRIGHSFFRPGVGYGGSCLPKDVQAFIAQTQRLDYDFELLKSVESINSGQIERFIAKVTKKLATGKSNLAGTHLAVLGLAFKPNTDDMRDAPSIKIINRLLELKAQITAFDPAAMEKAKVTLGQIEFAPNAYSAVKDKDAMLIITDWPQFKELDYKKVKKLLKSPLVFDGRNILDPRALNDLGFEYIGIGK